MQLYSVYPLRSWLSFGYLFSRDYYLLNLKELWLSSKYNSYTFSKVYDFIVNNFISQTKHVSPPNFVCPAPKEIELEHLILNFYPWFYNYCNEKFRYLINKNLHDTLSWEIYLFSSTHTQLLHATKKLFNFKLHWDKNLWNCTLTCSSFYLKIFVRIIFVYLLWFYHNFLSFEVKYQIVFVV